MRPPFLYLLFNLLIILLGAESGVLTAFSTPPDEKIKPVTTAAPDATTEASPGKSGELSNEDEQSAKKPVEKNAAVVKKAQKVKKCPSMPSLFFIGGGNVEEFEEEEDDEVDGDEGGDQLFAKAEMFIGDFYKQLKIQREESWKKIHGLYHRAF